jgi:hypothetical protein
MTDLPLIPSSAVGSHGMPVAWGSLASDGSVPGSEGTVTGAKGWGERCWMAFMSLTVPGVLVLGAVVDEEQEALHDTPLDEEPGDTLGLPRADRRRLDHGPDRAFVYSISGTASPHTCSPEGHQSPTLPRSSATPSRRRR